MQENDFNVEITAETWREIWQNAIRICLSSSTQRNSALNVSQLKNMKKTSSLCPQWKMTEDTYNHSVRPGRKIVHCWSNIVQELQSIFGVGCDVNPLISGFLMGRFMMKTTPGCCLCQICEPRLHKTSELHTEAFFKLSFIS